MPLVPYLVNNQYGFVEKGTSNVLINPIYKKAEPEICSRLVVAKSEDGEKGVVDTDNNVVLPLLNHRVQIFETTQLITSLGEKDHSVLTDLDGHKICSLKTDNHYFDFTFRQSTFEYNNNYGIITKEGEILFQPEYQQALVLGEQQILLQKKERDYQIVDDKGETIFSVVTDYLNHENGKFIITQDNKVGLLDENGQELIAPQYVNLWLFKEYVFAQNEQEKWGLLNLLGQILLPFQYDALQVENEWPLVARVDAQFFLITEDLTIFPLSSDILEASRGVAGYIPVQKANHKWEYINTKGKTSIEGDYFAASVFNENETAVVAIKKPYRYSLINKKGEVLTKKTYNYMSKCNQHFIGVEKGKRRNRYGVLNMHGQEIAPCNYVDIFYYGQFVHPSNNIIDEPEPFYDADGYKYSAD
ncbi:MAG: WG repeat-containing protein [Aureispira sp.]